MPEERPQRFFVTITAADPEQLREVGKFDLDLFSHRHTDKGPELGGLVTLEDIGRLVEAGYQVHVQETDTPREKPEYARFDEWRDELVADLRRQQKKER